jgi:hypothetical protein
MRSARMGEPRAVEEGGPRRAVGGALAAVPTAPLGQDMARA